MGRERHTRGAAPKVSLVLTGIETFAVLIISIIVLISGRRVASDTSLLTGALGSGDSTLDELLTLFGTGLTSFASSIIMFLGVTLLIAGIWFLIFWFVCVKSKHHRVRQIICTFIGRIPGIILISMIVRMGMVGPVLIFLILWIIINLLLSAFGWNNNRSSR